MADYTDVLAQLQYTDLTIHRKPIGQGKFGKVHKAFCQKLNRDVAVKIISDKKIFKKEEIDILLKSVAHDNVVSIKAVIAPKLEGERYWIVMEFCDYNLQQIRDKIPDEKIPWARWTFLINDILAGLIYLHEKTFVHCDLKPENILVNDRFEAKIADVGLSRIAGEHYIACEKGDLVLPSGTLLYISPERLQNPYKAPEFTDDCYSCGLLLYKMITNGDLFHLKDTPDEKMKISCMKMWLCDDQYRHPLKDLKDFFTPQEIVTAIGILWNKDHDSRSAVKAQDMVLEAMNKHGYRRKETLEEADKFLKNLMDDKLPSEPQNARDSPDVGKVDSPDGDSSEVVDLEQFVDDIADLDGISDWKQFARKGLKLRQIDLDSIEEEHWKPHAKRVAMLMKWREQNGFQATTANLEKALEKCKFKLAAQKLRKIEGIPQ